MYFKFFKYFLKIPSNFFTVFLQFLQKFTKITSQIPENVFKITSNFPWNFSRLFSSDCENYTKFLPKLGAEKFKDKSENLYKNFHISFYFSIYLGNGLSCHFFFLIVGKNTHFQKRHTTRSYISLSFRVINIKTAFIFTFKSNLFPFIPRPYDLSKPTFCQLVGFCDASDKAYCIDLYLHCTNDSSTTTQFICAKTRLAPVKSLTIPQLELQEALLLSELTNFVIEILQIDLNNVYLFCDFKVVLAWLAKPDDSWNVSVKNYVCKIPARFPPERWFSIRINQNPADLAIRKISSNSLINSPLWSHGSNFLSCLDFFYFISKPGSLEMSLETCGYIKPRYESVWELLWSIPHLTLSTGLSHTNALLPWSAESYC